MDYAQQVAAQQAAAAFRDDPTVQKPLESISGAVQRINTAQVSISRFIDRFHGPQAPEPVSAGGTQTGAIEVPPPYGVGLERLFQAIDRLETRIETLNRIG